MKQPNKNDELFKKLAQNYVDFEGSLLDQEQQHQASPWRDTPQMDEQIRALSNPPRKRKKHTAAIMSIIGACIALFFLIPNILKPLYDSTENPSSSGEPNNQLIPINFKLPDNMSVLNAELDNGQSVYTLGTESKEDMVLVMSMDSFIPDYDEFGTVKINGRNAYVKQTESYNILLFTKDSVNYKITSRYSLDSVLNLGKIIL